VLASGQTLKLLSVVLYEQEAVNEIASLKAQAAKNFGGVSTGIGFWGSPGWVLGGAAVLGLLEGALSNSAKKQGIELLRVAEEKYQLLVQNSVSFDALELLNAQYPHPQSWFALRETIVDVSKMNWRERDALLARFQKTKKDIANDKLKVQSRYIHNGDEFVNFETNVGKLSVRWSHVVAYFPPQRPLADKQSALSGQTPNPQPPVISFRDMQTFPRGTTVYKTRGGLLALLPDGSVLFDDGKDGRSHASVDDYRKVAGDRDAWEIFNEF